MGNRFAYRQGWRILYLVAMTPRTKGAKMTFIANNIESLKVPERNSVDLTCRILDRAHRTACANLGVIEGTASYQVAEEIGRLMGMEIETVIEYI